MTSSRLWTWIRNRRGVAAVEFAFVAPILILGYFAAAEICGALVAESRAQHLASVIGDVIGQCQTYSASTDFGTGTGFFVLGDDLMYPLNTSTLSMRITQITANATDTVFTVNGIAYANGTAYAAYTNGQTLTNSNFANIIPASGSIVMVESRYVYTSPVQFFLKSAQTYSTTVYAPIRQVTQIQAGAACTS